MDDNWQIKKFDLIEYNIFIMSTRSKYNRVRPQEDKKEQKPDHEILMRLSDRYGKYVSRALTLFFGEDKKVVTIKAAERVIDRALWVAEVVRRKVPDLHQIINISETKIVDIYEPKEEGLIRVEQERFLTVIEITLTRTPTAEQKKAPGYHAPLKKEEGSFLTKESWERNEKQRAEKREHRGADREGKEDRPRRERSEREDTRGGERGGERRRGGRGDRDRRE